MSSPPPLFWSDQWLPCVGWALVTRLHVGGSWYMLISCSMKPVQAPSAEHSAAHDVSV
eukprot:COSAG04_NODE_2432_length_4134_cov_3.602726_6_plen_57_part_01